MLILKGVSDEVNAVRFTPDGRGLVTSTSWGDQLWADWSSGGKPVTIGELSEGAAWDSPDGRYALCAGGGHAILYDKATGTTAVLDSPLQENSVALAAFTPDSERVITQTYPTGDLRCYHIEAPHAVVWSVPKQELVAHLAFVNDGRFVAFEYVDQILGRVAVTHDATTGSPVGEVRVDIPYTLKELTTSPDRRIIVGYDASKFFVYQSADLAAAPIVVWNTSRKAFSGLAFHPAGRILAATSNDASVKLYDVATWAVTRTLDWSIGRLRSVAFSPDGTLAAAGGDKGLVVVWDFDE